MSVPWGNLAWGLEGLLLYWFRSRDNKANIIWETSGNTVSKKVSLVYTKIHVFMVKKTHWKETFSMSEYMRRMTEVFFIYLGNHSC